MSRCCRRSTRRPVVAIRVVTFVVCLITTVLALRWRPVRSRSASRKLYRKPLIA